MRQIIRLAADKRGVTALEYGIIAGTLGIGLIAIFYSLGVGGFVPLFNKIGNSI